MCDALELEHLLGLPLVHDCTVVALNPKGGTRAMRDTYNEEEGSMHMIMENVWLMSKWAAYNQREMENNGIKATLCVAPNIVRFANKAPRVKDLDPIDMNEVCEGKINIKEFGERLLELYRHWMQGGVGIYCRNGANRSPLGMIAFVMMVTGCSINEAICHVSSLRALTDIREPKHGNFVTPMKFLEKNEKYLKQLLAPKEQFCLPRTVKPDKFRAAWGTLKVFLSRRESWRKENRGGGGSGSSST